MLKISKKHLKEKGHSTTFNTAANMSFMPSGPTNRSSALEYSPASAPADRITPDSVTLLVLQLWNVIFNFGNSNQLRFRQAEYKFPDGIKLRALWAMFFTMHRLVVISIISAGLISCSETKTASNTKTLDFGLFTLDAPIEWTKINKRGIDSYVGRIAIDANDTLEFDLGWYSNDLTEYQEVKLAGKTYYISHYDTSYSPVLVDSVNKDKVVKSKVTFDTIDGRRAKVLSPIKPGVGTTGIYVDSLWQRGSDVDKFNLYGINLRPANEKAVLAAFKTLNFIKSSNTAHNSGLPIYRLTVNHWAFCSLLCF